MMEYDKSIQEQDLLQYMLKGDFNQYISYRSAAGQDWAVPSTCNAVSNSGIETEVTGDSCLLDNV